MKSFTLWFLLLILGLTNTAEAQSYDLKKGLTYNAHNASENYDYSYDEYEYRAYVKELRYYSHAIADYEHYLVRQIKRNLYADMKREIRQTRYKLKQASEKSDRHYRKGRKNSEYGKRGGGGIYRKRDSPDVHEDVYHYRRLLKAQEKIAYKFDCLLLRNSAEERESLVLAKQFLRTIKPDRIQNRSDN